MDGKRFDLLARTVIAAGSRRGALRLLIGGAIGAVAGLTGARRAAACRGYRDPCTVSDQCCPGTGLRCRRDACRCPRTKRWCGRTGRCIPKDDCCRDADCWGGMTCVAGRCACPGAGNFCLECYRCDAEMGCQPDTAQDGKPCPKTPGGVCCGSTCCENGCNKEGTTCKGFG